MSKPYKNLGKQIKKYRKLKNYSTAEFAKELGVSAGLINNIENARNDVFKLELLLKIMDKLDVSLGELLQLKTIDVRKIEIDEENNFFIDETLDDSKDIINKINEQINLIIQSYLSTIFKYGCTGKNIDIISEHILNEFETLIKLHKTISFKLIK